MKGSAGAFLIALGLASVGAAPSFGAENRAVELHSHLFMREGMGWMATGDFRSPLRAKDWKSRFASQANPDSLNRSGIRVAVAALYAHPVLVRDLRASIREQIRQARQFVAENPEWVLATDGAQAVADLAAGKRILILALEGADGILDTGADLAEFVDQGGIRIVTLLHLTDDQYGGVAFLRGFRALASPWAFLTQMFSPTRDPNGVRLNRNGLSPRGLELAQALVAHRVWIDLAHASDAAYVALRDLSRERKLPLLFTHTSLRRYLGAERGISEAQLRDVADSHGVVGLMTSEEMLQDTPADCDGSFARLRTQYADAARIVGENAVVFGSDTNGGIPHLSPGCGLGPEGFWNIGQTGEVWNALKPNAARDRSALDFLCAWARAQGGRPTAISNCPNL